MLSTPKFKKTQNTLVASNDHLLIQIVSRLPAKSILRFKSVSKHWLSLLSDRSFTLLFDKLSISPGLFFDTLYIPFDVENQSSKPFRGLSFCHDILGITITQSCNGLLLCCTKKGFENTRKYYIFNPTTKQFSVISPLMGSQDIRTYIGFMGLAFHPTDCVHYKVVRVYTTDSAPNTDRKLYHIQIYASDTGKWRTLHESFPLSIHNSLCNYVVYWNGAIHWVTRSNLFYFKLESEQLQNLALPDYYENGTTRAYFGESRGHLHFVQTADHENRLHLNVYEMLNDQSGWFIKYHVELAELSDAYPEINYNYPNPRYALEILDIVRGEKEEDTFMVVRIHKKIIQHNFLDKSFKLIYNLCGNFYYRGNAHRYIESIVSF